MKQPIHTFLKKIPGLKFSVYTYRRICFYLGIIFYNKILLPRMLRKIRCKEKISVAFEAWNVPMWKYHSLYKAMEKDDRFDPFIVLTPSPKKIDSGRQQDLEDMRETFSKLGYKIYPDVQWNALEYNKKIPADIIFFCQPYIPKKLTRTLSKYIFCHCCYGFETSENKKWSCDTFLLNIALCVFVDNKFVIDETKIFTFNHSKNRIRTGHVYADSLIEKMNNPISPWKMPEKGLKRIIWAPHFSVNPNHVLQYSTFIKLHKVMCDLAEEFKGKVQWAFKPHPFLYDALCKMDGWGIERTKEYYDWWANQEYTQLEIGVYEDLFATSDAMIHDSASFIAEYLFTEKPCFYTNPDDSQKNTFGKMALDCYYRGNTKEDIRNFIQNVVLEGMDTMKEKRAEFYEEYLVPPNGRTAADNIIDALSEKIWGQDGK